MVTNTNAKHSELGQFHGDYFQTVQASPFEVWLAGLLEYAADYERSNTIGSIHSVLPIG